MLIPNVPGGKPPLQNAAEIPGPLQTTPAAFKPAANHPPQKCAAPAGDPLCPVFQPYINANIDAQSVASLGKIRNYLAVVAAGISFNGTDTFTVSYPGLYSLSAVLNIAPKTPADSMFAVSLNDSTTLYYAPSSHSGTDGQFSLIRIGYLPADTTLALINLSAHAVSLQNGDSAVTDNKGSAGHFCLYRFADGAFV